MTSQNLNYYQMNLLSEPAKEDVNIVKIKNLADELTKEDIATVNQTIEAHRLNESEIKLLMELLDVNYILDVG